jgi:zinc transporter
VAAYVFGECAAPTPEAILLRPTLVTGIFGMNTKGLPFTELDTAFLWASALMLLSSFAAYPIMKRIGILR